MVSISIDDDRDDDDGGDDDDIDDNDDRYDADEYVNDSLFIPLFSLFHFRYHLTES